MWPYVFCYVEGHQSKIRWENKKKKKEAKHKQILFLKEMMSHF